MRPRIRRLVLAAFGVLGGAAAASAQEPVPAAPPVLIPVPQSLAAPPPAFVQVTPAALPTGFVAPVAPAPAAAPAEPAPTGLRGVGYKAWNAATIGPGCANPVTCGNWATERTFLFGSCCQFFNPGNKCAGGLCGGGRGYGSRCAGGLCGGGYGGGCGGGLFGRCAAPALGTSNLSQSNTCLYSSYLNR